MRSTQTLDELHNTQAPLSAYLLNADLIWTCIKTVDIQHVFIILLFLPIILLTLAFILLFLLGAVSHEE